MKRYTEYIDSGVEWIGKIPTGWMLKKIKHNTYVKGRIGWQGLKTDEYLTEGFAYLITGTDFLDGTINWESCFYVDQIRYNEDPHIQLKEGDLLITKDGTIGKIALVNGMNRPSTLNSGIFLVRPTNTQYKTSFLYWILCSNIFNGFFEYRKSGSTISHLYQNVFVEFCFPIPSLPEQSHIATFLEHKTHQIDDLITKKQRLIELLQEERTTLINQAVTKGLEPTMPMKDSGIVWLGEIPEHWESKRLKFLVNNIIEKSNNSEFKVALENIESWSGRYLLTENPAELTGEMKHFLPNDILFNKLRPYLAKVYLPFKEGECVGELLVLRSKSMIDPKFLYYRLISRDFIEIVNGSTYGAKMPRASWEDFIRNLLIPYPQIKEQQEIVEEIEKKYSAVINTIEKLKAEIDLISEYKSSLINEAITGKIDVRDYKIYHA